MGKTTRADRFALLPAHPPATGDNGRTAVSRQFFVYMARDILRPEVHGAGVRCSLRMVEDWLFPRLVEMDNGNTAITALVTRKVPHIAETVVHYSALPTREAMTHLANASADFDVISASSAPGQVSISGSR